LGTAPCGGKYIELRGESLYFSEKYLKRMERGV